MPADEGRPAPRTLRASGHIRLAQSQALVHGQPRAGGQQTQDLGSHGHARAEPDTPSTTPAGSSVHRSLR